MCKIANLFITIFANYFDNVQRREALAKYHFLKPLKPNGRLVKSDSRVL
jgi:hypothetical protein